jgi:23S rRNA pseudouridine1911/1915/1917 synthase
VTNPQKNNMKEVADYRLAAQAQNLPNEQRIPPECAGLRFDAALAQMFPAHSRSRLQGWIRSGHFLVDGAPLDAKRKVFGGEVLRWVAGGNSGEGGEGGEGGSIDEGLESLDDIAVSPAPTCPRAEAMALTIVFEDDQLIVINKPAGLVVHPGNGNPGGTLMNGLLHHCPALADIPRAGIVHRLDKDTSGLMVVAKTLTAQTALVRQLQARTVKRHYMALAIGSVAGNATVDAPIGRHPVHRTRMAVAKSLHSQGAREARTHYEVRERFARCTLIECRLDTGRTHQIRVHMAHIGHPLAGDPVYGKARSGVALLDAFTRQALHAWELALIHPEIGIEMRWQASMPADFAQLLEALRDE